MGAKENVSLRRKGIGTSTSVMNFSKVTERGLVGSVRGKSPPGDGEVATVIAAADSSAAFGVGMTTGVVQATRFGNRETTAKWQRSWLSQIPPPHSASE